MSPVRHAFATIRDGSQHRFATQFWKMMLPEGRTEITLSRIVSPATRPP